MGEHSGVTRDGGGGVLTQVQGIGCFPSLMASATVETPVTVLLASLAGTGCPLRPLWSLLPLFSRFSPGPCMTQVLTGACHSWVWKVGSIGSQELSEA